MIKVEKDIDIVPESLRIPDEETFPNGIPLPLQTTHLRRLELITNGSYIDTQNYNNRYKFSDIRTALKDIYNHKCAFCEQKVEQYHVEHYRPKRVYYWLAYSWDNLLMACPTCNEHKGTNFDLIGVRVIYVDTDDNLKQINNSSEAYDETEQPKMVNPEVTNPFGKIKFQKNGIIESDDDRFAYTIKKCQIDRTYLNDERRAILEDFKNDISAELMDSTNIDDQKERIDSLVRKFIRDSINKRLPFLGFRRYSVAEGWLNDIVKEISASENSE